MHLKRLVVCQLLVMGLFIGLGLLPSLLDRLALHEEGQRGLVVAAGRR